MPVVKLEKLSINNYNNITYYLDFLKTFRNEYKELVERYDYLYSSYLYIYDRLNYIKALLDSNTLMTIKVNVTSISSSTKLCSDTSCIDEIKVDDNLIPKSTSYKFNKTGEHTVTIKFNTTNIPASLFINCTSFVDVILPNVITSIGNEAFKECSNLQSVIIQNQVTTIGSSSFYKCTELQSILIPKSVTSIGDLAFSNCPNIKSINVNNSNNTYKSQNNCIIKISNNQLIIGCQKTKIPNTVTSIANYAFFGCTNLNSITIPSSVTSIGQYAFNNCSKLTSITIPDSVTSISAYAFRYCSGLTSVTIGNSVTSIGGYAFQGCSRLTSITIPNSVTSINNGAFYDCSGLTSITIPDSVTSISAYAFQNCSGITSVTIGSSVTSIGTTAFRNCSKLKFIYLRRSSYIMIYNDTFQGVSENGSLYVPLNYDSNYETTWMRNAQYFLGYYNWTLSCGDVDTTVYVDNVSKKYNLTNLNSSHIQSIQIDNTILPNIPNNLKQYSFSSTGTHRICYILKTDSEYTNRSTIGTWKEYNGRASDAPFGAFEGSDINTLKISPNITSIGFSAFYHCSKLSSVTIPNSVTEIGRSAFNECTSLTSIIIPDSVQSINDYAFYYCDYLSSINIPDSVTGLGIDAFSMCRHATNLSIGSGLTKITYQSFRYCYGLESITVDPENITYESNNYNAIIHKDDKILVYGCQNTVIPTDGSVTQIGKGAFYGCITLRNAIIPNTITKIDDYAYYECCGKRQGFTLDPDSDQQLWIKTDDSGWVEDSTYEELFVGLQAINGTFNSNLYTYEGVNIPNSVTYIGSKAFYNCCDLRGELIIPDSVEHLGGDSFMTCIKLTSISIGNNVSQINDNTFRFCYNVTSLIIGNHVTSIGNSAFYRCRKIPSVTLPNSLQTIANYAFNYCENIKNVYNGNNVKSIGTSAFDSCSSLTSFNMSNTLETIGELAFANTGLTSVTIPASVTSIGTKSFFNSRNITSFNVDSSNTRYYSYNYNAIIDNSTSTLLDGCISTNNNIFNYVNNIAPWAFYGRIKNGTKTFNLPNRITSIGEQAFYECTSLTSINLSLSGITEIEKETFKGCTGLQSITFSNYITKIGEEAFKNCTNIFIITLPNGLIEIQNYAFEGCSGLSSINIPNYVNVIRWCAFRYCNNLNTITCYKNIAPIIYSNTFEGVKSDGKLLINSSSIGFDNWIRRDDYYLGYYNWICPKYNYLKTKYYYDSPWGPQLISVNNSNIKSVIVDGVEISQEDLLSLSADPNYYTFGISAREGHIVEYVLKNPTFIGANTFEDHNTLCEVMYMPELITTIGDEAFKGCTSLYYVHFGKSVTTIGNNVFYNCTNLTSTIELPSSLSSIGNQAFYKCQFTNIECNAKNAPQIQYNTFQDIPTETELWVPIDSTGYETWLNKDAYYLGYYNVKISNYYKLVATYTNISANSNVILCNGLTGIAAMYIDNNKLSNIVNNYTFETGGTHTVTWVFSSSNDNIINENAFKNTSIYSIIIPDSVTLIDDYAFSNCSNLTSVTIGHSILNLGDWIFKDSSALANIICYKTIAPSISTYTFVKTKYNGTLKVPSNATGYNNWVAPVSSDPNQNALTNWTLVKQQLE